MSLRRQRHRIFLVLCALVAANQFISMTRLMENVDSQKGLYKSKHTTWKHRTASLPTKFRVVDLLSIGSNSRLEYLEAQRETFGKHLSVRLFFNATEDTDDDPTCSQRLSKWNVTQISRFCHVKKKWNPNRQFLMSYLKSAYANEVWLRRKPNSPGWMCAQTRPMQGLYQLLQFYKVNGAELPDFLIILDDDTYYNLPLFHEYFQKHHPNSSKPLAVAGCRVRSPVHKINFTIPFGGYGLTLSKGYLTNLIRPIHCPEDEVMCHAIRRRSHLNEREVFQDGMSVADLMHAYIIHQPYVNFSSWTTGFCLHSDWVWGFISNFYNLSDHTIANDEFASVPESRLEAYRGSELNAGDLDEHDNHGICEFQRGNCDVNAEACHYSTPEEMAYITDMVRQRYTDDFQP